METDYRFQPKGLKSDLGWYDRGYLPHFDGGQIPQFLTFRLCDSLPQSLLKKWKQSSGEGKEERIVFRKTLERFLDAGYGECYLRDPSAAKLVEDSLKFHHDKKYRLVAWVIMPNHVHFLVIPYEGVEISTIAHSIKSYTAHEINKLLGREGQFWQHEPFDRYIRNARHFVSVIRYIENNPVEAGLCETVGEWPFSSAYKGDDAASGVLQAGRLRSSL